MKSLLVFAAITASSLNCFASSVCVISITSSGYDASDVICDGKHQSSFKTAGKFYESITVQLKALTDKGYKLQTSTSDPDGSHEYILTKD